MTAVGSRLLSIIIPSFNDMRILDAIDSVRMFDDIGSVSIIVVDGASKPEVLQEIKSRLTADDLLISEPDKGIFDAFNKGLAATQTPYLGWLGSDDAFSGIVKAREIVDTLKRCDLFIAATAHVQGACVKRVTPSWPSRFNLANYGFNNPHFSTFGKSELFKREEFQLHLRGSDVEYFLRIFSHKPRVITSNRISTLMELGGFSNSNYKSILKTNRELYSVYRSHTSAPVAMIALTIKLASKAFSAMRFAVMPLKINRIAAG